MATETVNQSPARAATYNYVIDGFEERRDQLHALALSLLQQVAPEDPKNPEEECNLAAWRLAQIMYDMLSCDSLEKVSRKMLFEGMNQPA